MKDFRDLQVWQKSHQLVLALYKLTECFPEREWYDLVRQLRRAASSIPTNIAEGCGRGSEAEFHRFLQIAAGSASEVEYELLLARDLGYLTAEEHRRSECSLIEVKKMLNSLCKRVRASRAAEC